jgi:hypothetical protein
MIKLPISTIENNPFSPICLWCHKPLERVGITTTTLTKPQIKSRRFACIYHPQDIIYVWKNYSRNVTFLNNDGDDDSKISWHLNYITVNISPNLRLLYSQNKMVHLQQANVSEQTYTTYHLAVALNNQADDESSWPHQLSYDDLIKKVKGYLPFL